MLGAVIGHLATSSYQELFAQANEQLSLLVDGL